MSNVPISLIGSTGFISRNFDEKPTKADVKGMNYQDEIFAHEGNLINYEI